MSIVECFRRVNSGGEGRARGQRSGGKPGPRAGKPPKAPPDAVNSGPPPPRRAALAPAVHPPETLPSEPLLLYLYPPLNSQRLLRDVQPIAGNSMVHRPGRAAQAPLTERRGAPAPPPPRRIRAPSPPPGKKGRPGTLWTTQRDPRPAGTGVPGPAGGGGGTGTPQVAPRPSQRPAGTRGDYIGAPSPPTPNPGQRNAPPMMK